MWSECDSRVSAVTTPVASNVDQIIDPLIRKSLIPCRRALRDAGIASDELREVVMVGGSSCIPLIVEKMKELFGEDKVLVHRRPLLAIAEGAAIRSVAE